VEVLADGSAGRRDFFRFVGAREMADDHAVAREQVQVALLNDVVVAVSCHPVRLAAASECAHEGGSTRPSGPERVGAYAVTPASASSSATYLAGTTTARPAL